MAEKFPPLPSGSVDAGALHKAAVAGKDLDKALAKAITRVEPHTQEGSPSPAPAKPARGS